jgi:hypothetical protein
MIYTPQCYNPHRDDAAPLLIFQLAHEDIDLAR